MTKFGPIRGLAIGVLFFPIVWAVAQPSASFRLDTPAAYLRLFQGVRVAFAAWAVGNFVACGVCVVNEVQWIKNPVVPSFLFVGVMELIMAAFGLSTPVRKRIHAWLGRIGTTVEVQAAAGVAALVGTLRPGKALVLAKERFCALPFEALKPFDFTNKSDTGLHEKSISMALGQCDAFISHVRAPARAAPPDFALSRECRCVLLDTAFAVMV
jgi:hypothetical protein